MITRSGKRGQVLITGYLAVFIMTVLGWSLLNRSMGSHRISQSQQAQADVLYLAEGGVEDAISKFSNAIANFTIDANAPRYPAVGSLTTTFANGATASSVVDQAELVPRTVIDPDGISLFVKNYHITTTVQHPSSSMALTLHQVIARRIIYTFQHAVFYDNDLEWHPGADMTLSGRVHSNKDMYLTAYTGKILTIDSEYVRSAGKFYHKRKDDGTNPGGTVQIKKAGSSPVVYPVFNFDSDTASWASDAISTWNSTVQSGIHGVTERAVPVTGSIAPGGFYDSNADVKIVNGAVTQAGVPLVEGTNIPPGTITTTTAFYNQREGKTVRMTNIDMKKLAGYHDCNGDGTPELCFPSHLPSNGLMYATRTDALATEQPGIRLVNGSEIYRAAGVTVVTNDPVYIQGNYNTTAKKPTAVIADAVHVLSNNWNDANSAAGINSRVATATTVNTAFIAGIKPTSGSQYSGGLENYPRLQEKWGGVQLTISGSFVSLWNSSIATGNWPGTGSVYTAPTRVWSYDTSFASGTSMPPFTPWAVEVDKGAWWVE